MLYEKRFTIWLNNSCSRRHREHKYIIFCFGISFGQIEMHSLMWVDELNRNITVFTNELTNKLQPSDMSEKKYLCKAFMIIETTTARHNHHSRNKTEKA